MARRPTEGLRVADAIQEAIADLDAGTWLPTWRELADAHGASLDTIGRALRILVSRGAIEHREGEGYLVLHPGPVTRVSADQLRVAGAWRGWHVVAHEQGRLPFTDSHRAWATLTPDAAGWLGLPVGIDVFLRWRTQGWVAGGRRTPVVLSWTWINPALTSDLPQLMAEDTGPGGITSLFEAAGYVVWWEEHVDARPATPDEAARLEVPVGAVVLDVWRRCYDHADRILEATQRIINPRLHRLIYRYP